MSPFCEMTVLRCRKEDNLNTIFIVILFIFKYNTQREYEKSTKCMEIRNNILHNREIIV